MKRYIAAVFLTSLMAAAVYAAPDFSASAPADTSRVVDIEEVVVVASPKENFKLREQPASVSLFSKENMQRLGINSVKNLSGYARNLFIPDYGSRLTSAMYIRGIGSRINTPAVGMYVDNMPVMDKSSFDFLMLDAERLDVLNGPQATLYGRNAMGGLIRMYTANPMRRQGTTINIGATGRTTGRRLSAVTRHKLSDRFAFSLGGYYSGENGFFRNDSTGRKADDANEAGARARAVYKPLDRLTLDLQLSYNYTDQGAYPYYYTGKAALAEGGEEYPEYIDRLTANRRGTYRRGMWTAGLGADYKMPKGTLASVTSWQFLQDRMFMDQDFLGADIYSLGQRQRNQSVSEELTYKTNENAAGRWQSATGMFFMHQHQHTESPVSFYSDGMSMLNATFARVIPSVSYDNPYTGRPVSVNMSLTLNDPSMTFRGKFRTPVTNYAVFHQSTFKDFLVENLSLTAGLRLDIEHQSLDCNMTSGQINYTFASGMGGNADLTASPSIAGKRKDDYVQLLPKLALQYDLPSRTGNVYLSFSKGYRSGGYNIQMFSELAQAKMQEEMMTGVRDYCDNLFQGLIDNARNETLRQMFTGIKATVDSKIPITATPDISTLRYKPEYSFNYEAGAHLNLLSRALQLDAAVFYMSTHNQQISKFSANGLGRQMVNAGRSACCGLELGLRSMLADGRLSLAASYGFTHSEFREFNDGKNDFRGNYVPFVPMHNMSVAANWRQPINSGIVSAISLGADLTGAGRIYWTEDNSAWQDFYANLGAHLTAELGHVKLNIWGKNLTNARYSTFYFETMSRGFEQRGAPCRLGADLTLDF